MLQKFTFAVSCCTLLAVAPAPVQAACPTRVAVLDLKNGASFNIPNPYVSYHTSGGVAGAPTAVPAAGCSGWKMAALKIVIPGSPSTCTQANVVVEYEGTPKLWSMNLGDSPTNDGFAGDAGTTDHEAEMWILDEKLSLAPADTLPGLTIDNPLVFQNLSLTDSVLKFVVRNQYVSWGQPFGVFVQEPATNNLFAIPDTTVPAADQRAIYLGLNRVIAGRSDRTGCGARRVMISFQ